MKNETLPVLALVAVVCLFTACSSSKPAASIEAPRSDAAESSSTVRLSIATVRTSAGGSLLVSLFADESSWLLDPFVQRAVPADRDTVLVAFEDVPSGRYAAAVIHDENGNGELDTTTFPFPKPAEGLAVSNNTWGFGRPDWNPATFVVGDVPVELALELRYF